MPVKRSSKRTLSIASTCSTESNFSYCSSLDSLSDTDESCCSTCLDIPAFFGATPTSPRDLADCCVPCCYLLNCSCGPADVETKATMPTKSDEVTLMDKSSTFQSQAVDTRIDAVINAVHQALLSSGQTCSVTLEQGSQGSSSTLIVAKLQSGSRDSSRCYDAVHSATRALEDVSASLRNFSLLSKRVQKDKDGSGYSLRSSVACIPEGAEDKVCWDLFQKGRCPRRNNCHWYHPQETDIHRVRVSIRCTEETEGQLPVSMPVTRHTISLGDLI